MGHRIPIETFEYTAEKTVKGSFYQSLSRNMNSDISPTLPQGVTHQKQQDYDIITWSNRGIPKKKVIFSFSQLRSSSPLLLSAYFSYKLFTDGLDNKTLLEQLGIIFFLSY